mgnify:CR=1 FL=1
MPLRGEPLDERWEFRFQTEGDDKDSVHVARLAGLPPAVVGRAWEVLRVLEAGHHLAHQPAPPPPDAAQLGLFAPTHPVVAALAGLDVDALTPLEALNRLAQWKRDLGTPA